MLKLCKGCFTMKNINGKKEMCKKCEEDFEKEGFWNKKNTAQNTTGQHETADLQGKSTAQDEDTPVAPKESGK